jgi:hypothetical protein
MGLPGESLYVGTLWETVCCSCAIGARRGSSHDSLRRPIARLMRVSFTDMGEMCCCGPGARAPLLIVLSFVAIRPTGRATAVRRIQSILRANLLRSKAHALQARMCQEGTASLSAHCVEYTRLVGYLALTRHSWCLLSGHRASAQCTIQCVIPPPKDRRMTMPEALKQNCFSFLQVRATCKSLHERGQAGDDTVL